MRKLNKSLVIILGSFLIVIGLGLISYKYIKIYTEDKSEEQKIEEFYQLQDIEVKEEAIVEPKSNYKKKDEVNYIAILKISKINLTKGLVDRNSYLNNIKYNVQILNESDSPDTINGNVILIAHSGTGRISYFRNLHKLNIGDIATIDYQNKTYKYELYKKYEIEKNGKATIYKDIQESTLTLITCVSNTNKQLVLIFKYK